MESPPNSSTLSEPFMLSDDSGLLLTSGSLSSGSMSGESHSCGRFGNEMQDSDCEDKSFSQADSLDGMSDIICGENFNTLKKMPHWIEASECRLSTPIDPPPEFQDKPNVTLYDNWADALMQKIIDEGIAFYCRSIQISPVISPIHWSGYQALTSSYWNSDFLPFGSPPSSRRSLVSSRLSSSHNSLSVPAAHKVDDSSFIMQAVSHDTLVGAPISDMYNVPFDSDMYSVPIDVVRFPEKHKHNQHKKKRRNTSSCYQEFGDSGNQTHQKGVKRYFNYVKCNRLLENTENIAKRHSVAGPSAPVQIEPIHMTLLEVRDYLQALYSSSSDSSVYKDKELNVRDSILVSNTNSSGTYNNKYLMGAANNGCSHKYKKGTLFINIKNKQIKNNNNNCDSIANKEQISVSKSNKQKKCNARISSFKQTLCNLFRFKRFTIPPDSKKALVKYTDNILMVDKEARISITNRALPPLPSQMHHEDQGLDFSTSIRKVKDYGWYWGPISSETAEKILSNEPDGSFIVRDSSDDHYIFSLTFKLNNSVRHVRIEHDQGNFSFGSCTKFKSQTIVEFIENAVEHSRSGRYLFFLHRRPVIGPVRVQLLHPVSRFKQIQSLQHMCRFIILKLVRRDLLTDLPLPRRMIDYLNTPYYYSEHLVDVEEKIESINSNNVSSVNSGSLLHNRENPTTNSIVITNGPVSHQDVSIIDHDYNSRQS